MTSTYKQPSATRDNLWHQAQQATLDQVIPTLTGRDWLVLSKQQHAACQLPSNKNVQLETIDPVDILDNNRITSLPAACADGIICDAIAQLHRHPDLLMQEIGHLLRTGGWAILMGAGSLRGKVAAGLPQGTSDLNALIQALENTELSIHACYSHGSAPHAQTWRRTFAKMTEISRRWVMKAIPSSHPLFVQWAATRPGWVLLLKAQQPSPTRPASSKKLTIKTRANAMTPS